MFIIDPYRFTAAAAVLFLDETGLDSAAGAWSVARKLRALYGGNCIRVRESAGSTEADIGFNGNELDTAALLAHCAGADGFVVNIYDQSGNARNLTQSTASAQPQIVSSGTILTGGNSKPECRFDGSNDMMVSGSFTLSNPLTHFMVCKQISWASTDRLLDGRTLNEGNIQQSGTSPGLRYFDGATGTTECDDLVVGTPGLVCAIADGASSTFSVNAGSDFTANLGTTASGGITLAGGAGGANAGNLGFQELVSYASNKTANRATARANMNAFYVLY